MTSHASGGVSCASVTAYALRRTIDDYPECDEAIIDAVRNSFYVDDCLKSVENDIDAIKVIEGRQALLFKRGFKLTKFVINHEELLDKVPIEDRGKDVKDLQADMSSKALVVKWNVKVDESYFMVE